MAIYRLSVSRVSRKSGRSAVAAAAYRAGVDLKNERDGQLHQYARRKGVLAAEILVPSGCGAEWGQDRAVLWNVAELSEKRADSRTATEFQIALPVELEREAAIALARRFAMELVSRYGVAADLAVHAPGKNSDKKNIHAHILLTTRKVMADGLGPKSDLELSDGDLRKQGKARGRVQIEAWRMRWAEMVNEALAEARIRQQVDHRSYARRGLDLWGQTQQGPQAHAQEHRAKAGKGPRPERRRLDPKAAAHNLASIRQNPGAIPGELARQQSVFSRRDLARRLHSLVREEDFATALALCESASVCLRKAGIDENGHPAPSLYSTTAQIELEQRLARLAISMARHRRSSIARQCTLLAIERAGAEKKISLDEEQIAAVQHICGDAQLSILVGRAGAGKTTALRAAALAWQAAGERVIGLAVAAKAATILRDEAGLAGSLTVAQLLYRLRSGRLRLRRGDVLLLDEVSMVSSVQLQQILQAANAAGSKVVLVGDPDQLQSVEAGGTLGYLVETCGAALMEDIRRQTSPAHRAASKLLAAGRVAEALGTYARERAVQRPATREAAIAGIVNDYMRVVGAGQAPPLVLGHSRLDVADLNAGIRLALKEAGRLGQSRNFDGREFSEGDQVVFRRTDRRMGVQNGTVGIIMSLHSDDMMVMVAGPDGQRRHVRVQAKKYTWIEHGYASTIHRAQGSTARAVLALAGAYWNRNLAYVALTRHREGMRLYADRETFPDDLDVVRVLERRGSHGCTLDFLDPLAPASGPGASARQDADWPGRPNSQPRRPQEPPRRPGSDTGPSDMGPS